MINVAALMCTKHDRQMRVAQPADKRHLLPLRRCSTCCAEFRAAVIKAKAFFKRGAQRWEKQRVLPPVIMSERWP